MTRKYKYWHRIVDASPEKDKELRKIREDYKGNLLITAYPTRNPKGRLDYINIETHGESWIDVEYVGRTPANLSGEGLLEWMKKILPEKDRREGLD